MCIQIIHGWLSKFRSGAMRICTEEPDYSEIPEPCHDWAHSVYADEKEDIPADIPKPKGKSVVTTSFQDANLHHDLLNGRSVTGILHLLNKTPIDWFSKLQPTTTCATYGSESISARTCVDQIVDLRLTLMCLGVPIKGPSFMFGDNEAVVTNGTIPHSKLSKRWHMLPYHRVRGAIAAGYIRHHHIDGKLNPADILTKHWALPAVWPSIQAFLFWCGDTENIGKKSKKKSQEESTT